MKSNLLGNPEQVILSFFDTKSSKSGAKEE